MMFKMKFKNAQFFKIAKITYKITAEQCARLTGSSDHNETNRNNVTYKPYSFRIMARVPEVIAL
jgi:hypothetical protein